MSELEIYQLDHQNKLKQEREKNILTSYLDITYPKANITFAKGTWKAQNSPDFLILSKGTAEFIEISEVVEQDVRKTEAYMYKKKVLPAIKNNDEYIWTQKDNESNGIIDSKITRDEAQLAISLRKKVSSCKQKFSKGNQLEIFEALGIDHVSTKRTLLLFSSSIKVTQYTIKGIWRETVNAEIEQILSENIDNIDFIFLSAFGGIVIPLSNS